MEPRPRTRRALTDNLVRLLRELGAGMHRFVVFELKVEPFKPEHVGKLNFYGGGPGRGHR